MKAGRLTTGAAHGQSDANDVSRRRGRRAAGSELDVETGL